MHYCPSYLPSRGSEVPRCTDGSPPLHPRRGSPASSELLCIPPSLFSLAQAYVVHHVLPIDRSAPSALAKPLDLMTVWNSTPAASNPPATDMSVCSLAPHHLLVLLLNFAATSDSCLFSARTLADFISSAHTVPSNLRRFNPRLTFNDSRTWILD
ncbi:hypothetical protein L226DRAFT_366324 [Lentinus tigrinus ALCF2SS1-7]|uniref:Uncharacterized protein n=1 Tax=Lentinus tigrinus ALCF2SS1-6 TaxID=1328759 RepID=A0A5C2RP81_9APHY|nr:hypothetical protein L227DRAFT_426138 [Lentinus tigrinus ALCF2SS1-6]RPD68214.1 hypothetical protein L226DRAFT_366324 [Lentinus tigrinus ALCF2SS1-7]